MSRAERNTLIRDLRLKGVVLEVVGDHVRVDSPKGAVSAEARARLRELKPRLLSALREEQELLEMPLSEFASRDRAIEVRVAWFDETLWIVPRMTCVAPLMERGIARGRIWTANELDDLLSIPAISKQDIRAIGRLKAAFGAEIESIEVAAEAEDGS